MSKYQSMSTSELESQLSILTEDFNGYKQKELKLVMSRGVPCPAQLDLSNEILHNSNFKTPSGVDCRNYGVVDGIEEGRQLFAELLDVSVSEVILGGNSSLQLMYETISRCMLVGVPGINRPWSKLDKIKFLCPSPGYDRHFSICELFGIEMIIIPMTSSGPDMNLVEKLVASDPSIKGIWNVPKYSNPEGITYSDDTVKRLAGLKTAADDFIIMWDNAYAFHHLTDTPDQLLDILAEAKQTKNENRIFQFASTSKITFAGSGISALITSNFNADILRKQINIATIGPDKIAQLRHFEFFKTADAVRKHMKLHANILKPKFDAVCNVLAKTLDGLDIAWWNRPNGGYFVNLRTLDGCADRIVKLAGECGVSLTAPAGSAFPYKKDPDYRNIRIAPSYPSIEELEIAINVLALCTKIASIEKALA
ncbi:MAG: aminotransferase class I/II-fold pyridoxal phosphate-dependent enzyme [Bacillota bacterium]